MEFCENEWHDAYDGVKELVGRDDIMHGAIELLDMPPT